MGLTFILTLYQDTSSAPRFHAVFNLQYTMCVKHRNKDWPIPCVNLYCKPAPENLDISSSEITLSSSIQAGQ